MIVKSHLKYFVLALFSVFALTACSNSTESPDDVIQKAKAAVVEVKSGTVKVSAVVQGTSGTDDLQFSGDMSVTFDKRDENNKAVDLQMVLSGIMKAGDRQLDGDLDFKFITLDNNFYLQVNDLSSSDPTIASIKPFVNMYAGKWLRIKEDFIPESIRNFQNEDEAMALKRQQLEDLFQETKLFTVNKEYGVEKLNGNKVYHYGLEVNRAGFKDYVTKAAIIDGRELTDAEVEASIGILDYLKDAELYIDTKTYYIPKSIFRFTGEIIDQGSNIEMELIIEGSGYNDSVDVKVPDGAEDFNPLNLLMGLGDVPTLPDSVNAEEPVKDVTEEADADDSKDTAE